MSLNESVEMQQDDKQHFIDQNVIKTLLFLILWDFSCQVNLNIKPQKQILFLSFSSSHCTDEALVTVWFMCAGEAPGAPQRPNAPGGSGQTAGQRETEAPVRCPGQHHRTLDSNQDGGTVLL